MMPRFLIFVSAVLFAGSTALAGVSETSPREPGGRRGLGQAVILSPARALTEADVAELAGKGVFIRQPLSGGRYVARVKEGARLDGDPRVLSLEPLTAEKKLHRSAVREATGGRLTSALNVVFHRDVPFEEARAAILSAGGTMPLFATGYIPSQRIEAQIPSAALLALAADERVLTIAGARRHKIESHNARTAELSSVNVVQAAPYGLTGAGVALSLFELGEAQATHVELNGRFTVNATGGSSGDKRHATHVAGTIAASGVNVSARGMAPAASLYQFCVAVPSNTCNGEWLTIKNESLASLGIVADNNSWGYILGWEDEGVPVWLFADVYWGAYDLIVGAPLDEISIAKDVLFVHSAGNDGNLPSSIASDPWKSHRHVNEQGDTISGQTWCVSQNGSGTDCPASCNGALSPCELLLHHAQLPFDTVGVTASAKNVVAVGAVGNGKQIVGFSSRGPAKDGRVKPDVVARGFGVVSSVPTDSYSSLNGTSMAAPAVTGIAGLLAEQWKKTFGARPKAAMLKGLLIAGAEDLGNPGPDYTYGFGLVNAKTSVDLILADEAKGRRIRTLSFDQGQQQQKEVAVRVTESQNVRVVLHWADPPIPFLGDDDVAAKALVNDLDLRVVDPSGNTWLPWVLDKVNYQADATRGVNVIDNVEVVEIPNAVPGVYRIQASSSSVLEGPQSAVLISSVGATPCLATAEFDNSTPETAFGNLPPGQALSSSFCSSADLDFFKFLATKTGAAAVTITTGDTAVRATLTGSGIVRTQEIAARTTAVLSGDVNTVPNQVLLKVEPVGTLGPSPQYSFSAEFGAVTGPKRRAARP